MHTLQKTKALSESTVIKWRIPKGRTQAISYTKKKKKAAGPLVGNSTIVLVKKRNDTDLCQSRSSCSLARRWSLGHNARGLQGRRADRESESGKHEEVPSDSAEPGKKAAMPST